jgi:hypothetical protein
LTVNATATDNAINAHLISLEAIADESTVCADQRTEGDRYPAGFRAT